jgi:nucleoside-diphosphate-sugar epimerase
VIDKSATGVIGASSLVGGCMVTALRQARRQVVAFSRKPAQGKNSEGVTWQLLPEPGNLATGHEPIHDWLCVAPIWHLPDYFPLLEACGARCVVALSSTSRFTKSRSSDVAEHAIAANFAEGEQRLQEWAQSRGVRWVVLRPTLIYGLGRDKNIAEITRFVGRFGFFPVFGKATGLRQPIHAEDVAGACVAALGSPAAANRAYNMSGAEVLTYREMLGRVFVALRRPTRLVPVPLVLFKLAVWCLRLLPRYRSWSPAMAERMNRDMVFDHADAARDFGFRPRPFALKPADVQAPVAP